MKKSFKILISSVLVLVLMMTVAFAVPGRDTAPGQLKKDYSETEQFNFKFNDMTGYEWAMKSVQNMADMGKIKGIGNGKFAPARSTKQIEILIMTLRYLEIDDKDLDLDMILEHAIDEDLLTQEEADDFNPNKPASRSWTAVYIIRALKLEHTAETMQNDLLPYNDAAAVPEDRIGYVSLITKLGLMQGYDKTFQPNKPLTRAEMAVLFDNLEGFDNNLTFYTITFVENKGTTVGAITLVKGTTVNSFPASTRDGYTFDGWYDNSNDEVTFPYTVDKNERFYAKWIENYTITFETNGGTTMSAITLKDNDIITPPTEKTKKPGYKFDGWFYDLALKESVEFNTDRITKDIILYADWIPTVD